MESLAATTTGSCLQEKIDFNSLESLTEKIKCSYSCANVEVAVRCAVLMEILKLFKGPKEPFIWLQFSKKIFSNF